MTRFLSVCALLVTLAIPVVTQGDVTPPSIHMNIADGNRVIPGSTVGILVWASDDIGVEAVDVWANNKWICHVTAPNPDPAWPPPPPYECAWHVQGKSPYTVTAQACDAAENCVSVTSHPVSVKK